MPACTICNGIIQPEKQITCDNCKATVHTTCSSLSRAEISCLKQSDRQIKYNCDQCKNLPNLLSVITQLKEVIEKLQQDVNDLKSGMVTQAPLSTETIISEVAERQARASNIIIFNIKESIANDSRARVNEDFLQVQNALKKIIPDNSIDLNETKMYRLGKPNPNSIKPRPLKVILKTSSDVIKILKNKSDFQRNSHIKITSDNTPMQRDYFNKIKMELQNRQEKGENDIFIRYLKGVPTIIKRDPKNFQL